MSGTFRDTDVEDPLTGVHRRISDFLESEVKAELRQDLGAAKLAWGLNFQSQTADFDYRSNEINSFRQLDRVDLFLETTVIAGTKVRLVLWNLLDDTEQRDRRFFSPDRSGILSLRETAQFHPEMWWMLTVTGNF